MILRVNKPKKKEPDNDYQHCCRWCHNYDRFSGKCDRLLQEIVEDCADYIEINNPEDFYCKYYE